MTGSSDGNCSTARGSGSSGSISSTFLGLKAELERSKASSSSSSASKRKASSIDELRKPSKKLSSTFLDGSTSKKPRDSRDQGTSRKKRTSAHPDVSFDRIRTNLERKARIYDQLNAGKYAGFTSAELDEGSIDWARKRSEPQPHSRSPSPTGHGASGEQMVEYQDEFGRTRTAPLSEVPREFLPQHYGGDADEEPDEVDNAVYGPSTSFPVYDPSARRREKEEGQRRRFDAEFDNRHRGAAFFKFSKEESERGAQMEQLAELRRETLEKRQGRPSNEAGSRSARRTEWGD